MLRLNLFTAVSFAVLLATGAQAADMPAYYEPEPVEEYGGWYLRGDVGASNQFVGDFSTPVWDVITDAGNTVHLLRDDFDASAFIGIGVGYEINDMFRVDVTGEYRFSSDFNGLDNIDDGSDGTIDFVNQYSGEKEEAVFLVNGYIDLPGYGIMTPFIGAGVGASWIKLSDFTDYNALDGATGLSGDVTSWNLAYAAYAGLAFKVTDQMTVEVGYRYLHLGDIETDDLVAPDGSSATVNPYNFDDLASHDVKVGMRYVFN